MLTISQVAAAANVNLETIRYYQRRGLMTEPKKPEGGHRRYSRDEVARVQFIKRAQVLGFSLDEIDTLHRLQTATSCADIHDIAVRKLAVIDSKIGDLTTMRAALADLVKECELGNQEGECPIIQTLATHSP